MKRFIMAAGVGCVLLASAVPAVAAQVKKIDFTGDYSNGTFGDVFTDGSKKKPFSIDDYLLFTVAADGTLNLSGNSRGTMTVKAKGDFDFTGVTLTDLTSSTSIFNYNMDNNVGGMVNGFHNDSVTGASSFYANGVSLSPGDYRLDILGTSYGNSSFSGTSGFTASVPEPAMWGLMIAGFGLVGYALRRRVLRFKLLTYLPA